MLYGLWFAKEELDETGDLKIGVRWIGVSADDLVVLAKEEKELQIMIDKVVDIGLEYYYRKLTFKNQK